MSDIDQAKISKLIRKKSSSQFLSFSNKRALTWTDFVSHTLAERKVTIRPARLTSLAPFDPVTW